MGKKIQQKIILFFAHIIAKPLLLIYQSTLAIRVVDKRWIREMRAKNQNYIICFWHENMILPLLVHRGYGIRVLVSQHFDGEIIARILHPFGLPTVRGSSTRGGGKAYLEMKHKMISQNVSTAFTPDGPTGPRRKMKLGAVRLASETGAPILPIGVASDRPRRLNSWDRLLLFLPGAKCVHKYGRPIYVPEGLSADELQDYAVKIGSVLDELDKEAEKWLFR